MNKIPLTKNGKIKLEKELKRLINIDREEIKKAISEARALGDLKENAEYHSAKEKQSLLEGKISMLQNIEARANVIDTSNIDCKTIVFGATVEIQNVETEEILTYKIVGHYEADIKSKLLSIDSPLGRSLIGKEEGDTLIVKAPRGDIEYTVESFFYD